MRLVWHIVQKDFRRLAAPLALWALLLIIRGEVGAHVLAGQGMDVNRLFYWTIANAVLLWLDVIVCVLLVAALVHEDPLVGMGAGWATRPISGGRLLAAKLLSAVLMFGALPMVAALRWWLVCGYGAAEMARAALAIAGVQAVIVFTALVFAALTKNINEFLGWILGLGLAGIAWMFVLSSFLRGVHVALTHGANETRAVFFLTLVLLGGATVIVVQFLTRRRTRALQVAATTAALLAIVFASGWDFSGAWARAPRTSPVASGITVTVERPKLEGRSAMDYVLRGVPQDFGVWASADHTWRWSDGTFATAWSSWSAGSWPGAAEWRLLGPHAGTANDLMMQAYAAYGPKRATQQDESIVPMGFFLPGDEATRLRAEPATYTGELHVALLRPTLEFELPLRDGVKGEAAGTSVRIDHFSWRDGQCRVTLVESRPGGIIGYWRRGSNIVPIMADRGGPATGFALVNRARGEAIKLWPGQSPRASLLVGTQDLGWFVLQGDVPRDPGAENSDAPPAWLKDATLAVVRYREEARFDREVKIEKFGGPETLAAVK